MTYEYVCASCAHEWEAEQPISARALKKCPRCGKSQAKRQVSGGTGFMLKGGGWYADGYGAKAAKTAESKPEKSTATPAAESGAKPKTPEADTKAKAPEKPDKKTDSSGGAAAA